MEFFQEGKTIKVEIILEHENVATKEAIIPNQDEYQDIVDKLQIQQQSKDVAPIQNKRKRGGRQAPAPQPQAASRKSNRRGQSKQQQEYEFEEEQYLEVKESKATSKKKGGKKLKSMAKSKKQKKQESEAEEDEDLDEELNSQQLYNLEDELEQELKKYDHEHSQHAYEGEFDETNLKSKESLYDDIFDDDNEILSSNKNLTKRQKNMNSRDSFEMMTLPDRMTKKKRNNNYSMTEEDQIKKMEKEEKRRQQMAKQQEHQKWEVVNKILNESGRKQKQRKEKEEREIMNKAYHVYKSLPESDVRISYIDNKDKTQLKLSKQLSTKVIVNGDYKEKYETVMNDIITDKYIDRIQKVNVQIQQEKEKEKEQKQLKKERFRGRQQQDSDEESEQDFQQRQVDLIKELEEVDDKILNSEYFEEKVKKREFIQVLGSGEVLTSEKQILEQQNKINNNIVQCSNCENQSKYKIPHRKERACSLQCYKVITKN